MVNRYVFGNPMDTEAIIDKPEASKWQDGAITFEDRRFSYQMAEEEIIYGLGEAIRGINKRGWKYVSHCSDDPLHMEQKTSLYGAHNFLLLGGALGETKKVGLFFDTPAKMTFDIGYTKHNELMVDIESDDLELYVLEGESLQEVIHEFRLLIGRSYIPPRFAFGYGQSRWSYDTAEDVRAVAAQYRAHNIPIDTIYMDIDYMERYKDFTISDERFPNFPAFVEEMKEQHIHLVPIIDAGVKKEDGYDVYEEGKEKGYFCKDADGEDFVVGVWPGKCCFPDMLKEDARSWFGHKYKVLLDQGIDAFWNDMNEPAIFYSEKRMKKVFDKLDTFKTMNLDVDTYFEMTDLVGSIANNPEDYASFYHTFHGKKVCHKDVHNLFGFYMTRSASEAFDELVPDKRVLMYSRASYIGMHRYGGIWQGDNMSWWSHLLMNIKMMPSLNMCGFLYTGADLGGFGADTTEDLMARWLEFGVFTPLMRNHSAKGTRRQEVYRFDNSEVLKDIIAVRYRLLPYLYSEYMKAALQDTMMFTPLSFVYEEDEIARQVEDQLFVGDSIMIAPVHEQNVSGRTVYFPERMKLLRMKGSEVTEDEIFEPGYHYVSMPLGEVCVFLRENQILPVSDGGEYVDEVDYSDLTLYSFGENAQPYAYYMDDGQTKEYDLEKYIKMLQ